MKKPVVFFRTTGNPPLIASEQTAWNREVGVEKRDADEHKPSGYRLGKERSAVKQSRQPKPKQETTETRKQHLAPPSFLSCRNRLESDELPLLRLKFNILILICQ